MPSNTTLNSGTGGDVIATKERTHDGDASKVQVVTVAGVTGTEGSYTFADIAAGAGAESAALRVTLATESLAALESLTTVSTVTTVSAVTAITNALPAGTNNIGDVDVLSLVPGTGATALGKAIDTAAGGTDTGVAVLAVRDDALTTLTPVDGDYVPLRTSSTGALHVNVASGGIAGIADDAAFTPGTSEVLPIGCQADETATDSVDEGDIGCPRMTLDRKQIVVPQPHTAGGLSIFRSLDLDETEEEAKATAGCVYGMWATNTATATRFIKFYNATAANVTVGTTTPLITIGIPGNSSDDVSANFGPGGMGITFDTAITLAATTGIADNDTGAPGANEVLVNLFYK